VKRRLQPVQVLLWAIISICTAVLSSGCSNTGKHVRWYAEPPRDPHEVALLTVHRSTFYASAVVDTIDGESLRKGRRLSRNNTLEIELLPGPHTLGVAYFEGSTYSISNAPLTATFQAGHSYDLRVAPIDMGLARTLAFAAFGGRGWWTAWITDLNTKEVVAGSPRLEPRRWYEY
jgi:hypothetical protein